MWSTFSFVQHSQQFSLPPHPIFSIFCFIWRFLPHLCWANTSVLCLQFKLSKLAIKSNGHTRGQDISLESVEFSFPATLFEKQDT